MQLSLLFSYFNNILLVSYKIKILNKKIVNKLILRSLLLDVFWNIYIIL